MSNKLPEVLERENGRLASENQRLMDESQQLMSVLAQVSSALSYLLRHHSQGSLKLTPQQMEQCRVDPVYRFNIGFDEDKQMFTFVLANRTKSLEEDGSQTTGGGKVIRPQFRGIKTPDQR